MTDTEQDPAFDEATQRVANKLLVATNGEPIKAVQVALANLVAQLALTSAAEHDRFFLETIDGMFQIYREVSNLKLRNEDPAVS